MDLVKSKTTDMPPPPPRKRKKVVLEEEEYLAEIETIIERDFFPDVPIMRQQLEQLQHFRAGPAGQDTPATVLGTPYVGDEGSTHGLRGLGAVETSGLRDTPMVGAEEASQLQTPTVVSDRTPRPTSEVHVHPRASKDMGKKMSLDQFLSCCTSEDNASFQVLQEESLKRKRQKFWHYLEDKNLPLLEGKPQTDGYGTTGQQPDSLTLWKHVPKNKLFYDSTQTGVATRTETEIAETVQGPPKEIRLSNTRFPTEAEAALEEQEDGMAIKGSNGGKKDYTYVATPVPVAGVNVSPIMTWGELGGTPIRLDGSMTPGFKICELSQRDKVGKALATSARKSIALRQASMTPTPIRLGSGKGNLSVAGQKLASAMRVKTPGTDLQLRASYSGTPYKRSKDVVRGVTPLMRVKRKGESEKSETLAAEGKVKGHITDGLLDG
ncbi:hypothetical protein BSKO_00437 [Bryopsis sp. KO-2023]|nr:hypothetical protein BSKO_00437 [Bryopsis sp. KO-2023]